ncbi:MAG TPA: Rrf2 family transcriptional regulator [Rhizomicrobium sp.]|jgi:Rrf2 family protein
MQLRGPVEWALHCCAVLAGLAPDRYLPTRDLADFHGVPKEYLSKALQALSQAGLVEGTLGPTGGYRLARSPDKITFLDVVEALEGKGPTFVCTNIRRNIPCLTAAEKSQCTDARPCAVARVMWDADSVWRDRLRAATLADLGKTLESDLSPALRRRTAAWLEEHS